MEVFIGRLHPLVVHLPIGFILLAFVLETMVLLRRSWSEWRMAIAFAYALALLASMAALGSGLLRAADGAFYPEVLGMHKWLGIGVSVMALLTYVIKLFPKSIKPATSYVFSVLLVLIVTGAGHYGGLLTHGKGYLAERAPAWVQQLLGGNGPDRYDLLTELTPDSVFIYGNLVLPALDEHCMACHNPGNSMGGFDASRYEGLIEEGENGRPVVPGNSVSSEIWTRISLPSSHQKFMPPHGVPMGYTDMQILKYWIEQGADTMARFDHGTMSPELIRLLIRDYQLDYTPRPYFEKVKVDSISQDVIGMLDAAGFTAAFLGSKNFFLDVTCHRDTLREDELDVLDGVSNNVTFLDMSGIVFSDTQQLRLSRFVNLTRLDLHGSNVTDGALEDLAGLIHLEVLNLYDTPVTETGLGFALAAPALKRIYVWQTDISEEVLEKRRKEFPNILFTAGLKLARPDSLQRAEE